MGGSSGKPLPRRRSADTATPARVAKILDELERAHPDARLALDFSTPLELLVALILAAQCTDAKVNEVTRSLFRRFATARDYAEAAQDELEEAVRPTGFYRQKAKTLRTCARGLVDRFGGEVPNDIAALLTLPGVGRKTANILRGNAFGEPGIGVDTHVARLSERLGLSEESDPDRIEADLTRLVPPRRQVRFCHLVQYHGRRVCTARRPSCFACTVRHLCPFPDKTPAPATAAKPTRSRWVGQGG
jgi:endonuclease-3